MTGIARLTPIGCLVLAATLGAGCSDAATPTSPTATPTSPVSVTYSTAFAPAGAAARAFRASQAGSVSVTLVSAGPPATVLLGLGVGIPRADGGGCMLASSVITPAGPTAQLTTSVDEGDYCVKVLDVGMLTEMVSVTITLVHP
ncbi:MAG: hypothetical protein ACRD2N_07485 [Vicinamibacterales bacterium]